MTNYYVTYTLADKKARDDFYEAVKQSGVPAKSREEEGCIRYEYFYPAESENTLFLWEQWESREAQKLHTEQPHFKELAKIKEAFGAAADILAEDQIIEN